MLNVKYITFVRPRPRRITRRYAGKEKSSRPASVVSLVAGGTGGMYMRTLVEVASFRGEDWPD